MTLHTNRPPVRIAVLLTCFNRRVQTLECLERLEGQDLPPGVDLSVFLVDDGSTDGTAEAVLERYPDVSVIEGDGNLFWCRGMDLAWQSAVQTGEEFDHFLMLNDDTVLRSDALALLLELQDREPGESVISVGLIRDPETDRIGYGVFGRASVLNPLRVELLQPDDERPPVAMNGNCVLVPKSVTDKVGFVDPVFHHRFGDMDLAHRARGAGAKLRTTDGAVGECPANPHSDVATHARSMSFRNWVKHLNSPKGLNPREWTTYARRHGGPFWWFFCVRAYALAVARWPLARMPAALWI